MDQLVDCLDLTKTDALAFRHSLSEIRARRLPENGLPWYQYDILSCFWNLSNVLTGPRRDIFNHVEQKTIADIGAADGDLGFFLASRGARVDIIDHESSNMNKLSGARTLAKELGLPALVHSINLDRQFSLPRKYDLVMLLGILYHLKNPFFALETLSYSARSMCLSTRIAEFTRPIGDPLRERIGGASAMLLASKEANNDDTNYWIFNDAALKLILYRTGWNVVDYQVVGGDLETSDPISSEGDRRAFCYLESRHVDEQRG